MGYKNQHTIRLKDSIESELVERSKRSNRSMNAEIEYSLEQYLFGEDESVESKLGSAKKFIDQALTQLKCDNS